MKNLLKYYSALRHGINPSFPQAEPAPVKMGAGIQASLNWTPTSAGVTFILQLIYGTRPWDRVKYKALYL
jgi:hypothetical protein